MKNNIIVYIISVILAFVLGIFFAWGFGGRWHRGYLYERGRGFGYGMHHGRGFGYNYGMHQLLNLNIMKDELGLTDKQVRQIFDIGTEYRTKYFENRNNTDKLTGLLDAHKKAVENVLTKEQLEKFNNLKDKYGYGFPAAREPFWDCPYHR